MNADEINELLEKGGEAIDITPSMFKEASGHYETIAGFLQNNGIEADVYPVGSIVMGTPTRPRKDGEDDYFDIDAMVNRTDLEHSNCKPKDVRNPVEELLVNSDRYGDKVESYDACITLKYVLGDIEDGFRLDLNTCVENPDDPDAIACETYPDFAQSTVAIAQRGSSEWLGSNPRGLCGWFQRINERIAATGRAMRKSAIARRNPSVFASTEQVPDEMDRSPLQRAVQIAKRSRDEFYERCGYESKPASCVLTVLFGKVAGSASLNATILDILAAFVALTKEAEQQWLQGEESALGVPGNWKLMNPVYNENLLRDWTDNDMRMMFKWVRHLGQRLEDLESTTAKCGAASEAIFGRKVGRAIMPAGVSAVACTKTQDVRPNKPWRAR